MKKIFQYLCGGLMMLWLGGALLPTKAVADVITMTTTATEIKISFGGSNIISEEYWDVKVNFGDGEDTTYKQSNREALIITHIYANSLTEKTITITTTSFVESLSCKNNQLTSLSVSGCTPLKWLNCENNQLTSLDVSGCTSLKRLSCYDNQLTSLDVSGCTSLGNLYCYDNQLTSLDVSGCTSLESLHCKNNQLTSLDASGCTSLESLNCENNQLTSLDASGCTSLGTLYCYDNQLTSLDVSGCTSLSGLYCKNNQLTSLDVSGRMFWLECQNNQLTSLDLSGCTSLNRLYCRNNPLDSLDISNLSLTYIELPSSLRRLDCSGNQLTVLSINGFKSLETLDCSGNQLTSLGVQSCTSLETLDCSGNQLTSSYLYASGCTSLKSLNCSGNQLASLLYVSDCKSLKSLNCSGNQLASLLDVSVYTSLETLDCSNNRITAVDAHNLSALKTLDCSVNQLTELAVSGCTSLETIDCSQNRLSYLSLSSLAGLKYLACDSNSITTLQLSDRVKFSSLSAGSNRLTFSSLEDLLAHRHDTASVMLSPQRSAQALMVGNWDLTSDMTIDSVATTYTLTDETGASVSEAVCVEKDGVFRFRQSGKYILTLTNPQVTDYVSGRAAEPVKVIYDVTVSGTDIVVYTVEAVPNAAIGGTVSGDGLFESGEEVTLTATPLDDNVFMHWADAAGNVVSTENPYTFAVTSDVSLTGVFKMYHTVDVTASMGGTVSQSGSGRYEEGTAGTLTATPAEGYTFVHWADADGNVQSTENPYTFAVMSDVSLTAVFKMYHTVDVTASAGGTVSQSGSGRYEAGTAVTLTATPAEGYTFVHWTDADGNVVSTENPCTFAVTSDVSLTAVFKMYHKVDVTASMGGTVSQSGSGRYEEGTAVTLTATPAEGYTFVHWADVAGNVKSTENPYTFAVTSDVSLTAVFKMYHTVDVTASAGGTVSQSGSGRYEAGTAVTLTATPAEGYAFVHWADAAGNVQSTENPYTFAVTSDVSLTAVFKMYHTVDVTASAGGTVSQSGSGRYEDGTAVTITATPAEGYTFVYWADADGNVKSTENPYTFAVTSDVSLRAVFKMYHNVDVTASAGGTVSQSGSGRYEEGETVTITATPSSGFRFVNWERMEEQTTFAMEAEYTFRVTEDLMLKANFVKENGPADTTAIEDLTVGAAPVVYVKAHTVYVTDNTAEVRVYTLGGLCVYSGRATAIPIRQSGVYVVSVGGRRCKILVP